MERARKQTEGQKTMGDLANDNPDGYHGYASIGVRSKWLWAQQDVCFLVERYVFNLFGSNATRSRWIKKTVGSSEPNGTINLQ
ncbi:hypothetical protein NPIL_280871 [Nephila pilipes]|uniref:Uncharacterized protein n=1 Tax=Nephila pilipes TaxID=299642 RepID=A0A8X6J8S1_NEPPI|nr:hypothetical protein NPIL_280871 [Nephila pilipes]